MKGTGIIQKDGSILETDGKTHHLPNRGTDDEGYPEVLMAAKKVGGKGFFHRQSIKPFIGMTVEFERVSKKSLPYNHKIIRI